MSPRARGILLAILGLGLVAVGITAGILLFRQMTTNATIFQPTPVPVVKTKVLVLTHDVALGKVLAESDVTLMEVPAEFVPRDAVSNVQDVVNKFVKADMIQGEMILGHNLADPTNINHDLAFILNTGHLLMTFPADDIMSQYVVQRGDIIDILATLSETVKQVPGTGTTGGTTGTGTTTGTGATNQEPVQRKFTIDAMQRVSVTAMVLNIITVKEGETPPKPRPVAYLLALNPQDALLLKFLKDGDTKFDIALRNPTSKDQFTLTPVTDEYIVELYGLEILP